MARPFTNNNTAREWSSTPWSSDAVLPIPAEEAGFGKVASHISDDRALKHLSESYNRTLSYFSN
jgi:hypothetical protein